MASATTTPGLSDAQLVEFLALTKGADSVELKLTVPMSDRGRAGGARRRPARGPNSSGGISSTRPTWRWNKQGLVVRARRVQGRGDDSVVKLRPVVPEELPPVFRRSPNFGVEVDAMPGGFVCSGSMKRALGRTDVREAVTGMRPVRKLFSKGTAGALRRPRSRRTRAREPLNSRADLRAQAALVPKGYGRRLVAELWLYADNSLSSSCRRSARPPRPSRTRPS